MIGLIGAMQVEMEHLLLALEEHKEHKIGVMTLHTGQLYGHEAVLAICGPGKVNAALCAQAMILNFKPRWVMNLGVAGAISRELTIGDLVVGTCAVQHDMDTSPIGDPLGLISGINRVKLLCAPWLRNEIIAAAQSLELRIMEGVIATGDQFIASPEKKEWIARHFDAVCAEMEGGAVAHTCLMHGVDCAVIRSISDQADGGATMDYPKFVELAAAHSAKLVKALLKNI
ncbi:MAG: 5'-methylthioadenosine/adenosylhomocysteine nucleosidase [Clostridia bacterium]|nr:5'-methylthioadenosine/adenosylhomocysteine nucleosidase [Clostridia bacterium]